MLAQEDLERIIWAYIGDEGIEQIEKTVGWQQFSEFADYVLQCYADYAEAGKSGKVPTMQDMGEKLTTLETEAQKFLTSIKITENATFRNLFGFYSFKHPYYFIYVTAKLLLLLAIHQVLLKQNKRVEVSQVEEIK